MYLHRKLQRLLYLVSISSWFLYQNSISIVYQNSIDFPIFVMSDLVTYGNNTLKNLLLVITKDRQKSLSAMNGHARVFLGLV